MIRFTTLWVLWMLLTGSLQWSELLTGTVIAALITGLSQRLVDSGSQSDLIFTPRSLLSLLRHLRVFALALIQANLDMARRVLSPSLPIDPAVVEVETTLQSTLGKLVLANSITLTPGTLTVDLQQNRLLVHWIDTAVLAGDQQGEAALQLATREIAAGFEQHLKGFLR